MVLTRRSRFLVYAPLLVLVAGINLGRDVAAADELRTTTSLQFAPADAAFYMTMLRNREQVEIFLNSNAYEKLRRLPLLSFGLSMLEGQWQNSEEEGVQWIRDWWEQQENRKLVHTALDALSGEIFVYGDGNYVEMMKLANDIQKTMSSIQIRAAQEGSAATRDEEMKKNLQAILEKAVATKLPATVVGFRVSDVAAVESELNRLEQLLNSVFDSQTELQMLKGQLKRESVGSASFLTLSLTGSLIPWDALPPQALEQLDENIRGLISKLRATISLGVKDGYLLLSIGESTNHLQRLGKGELLIDRPEFAHLRKHADRRIASIGYASTELMQQSNAAARQLDDMVATFEGLAPMSDLDAETTAGLLADVRELVDEIKTFIPKPAANLGFAFLTDRGFESYTYNWTENRTLDGSKKLEILDHLGGDPLAFVAARGKYAPESYDWCVKWAERAWRRIQPIALERLTGEERQQFEQIRDRALPLVKRFDQTTRESLIPALIDGQGALVLDAKATSKQWHAELPTTRVPLPMLELAIVYGVSDSGALRRAAREYSELAQEALNAAHELSNKEVPAIVLPSPEITSLDQSEMFSYPLPGPLGLDGQIAPNAGLSKNMLVLSLLPDQTKRLLTSTPWKGIGTQLATDRPLAAVSYCNMAGIFSTITPWINYGVRVATQAQAEQLPQLQIAAQMVSGNLTPISELLKCFGESASVTYLDDNITVTHSVTNFADPQ